ncbi:MAG: AMMECR1 domain-containing protein [Candidatus Gracilibacteria bacterium]|nr:AMMECR1 domain-containing protein [Candidatus Gracilibacteria bacterium]
MIEIVKQIIDFYLKNAKEPTLADIKIEDKTLLERQANLFVTMYKNGEVRGSAGNVKELEQNVVLELLKNTLSALTKDSRFDPVKLSEAGELRVRVDEIINRTVLSAGEIKKLDPLKHGVLVIKKDYSKLAVILPNISGRLMNGEDFYGVLDKKLGEKFKEDDYIVYSIETKIYNDL